MLIVPLAMLEQQAARRAPFNSAPAS